MDLCQKNEADLDSNEIQSTEETELSCSCPDERSERSHVCCLLSISDLTLEQDGRASEFVIGTGWEEAVQGWGKISPTACIWPRKKLKKARVGESANSSCLLCLNLPQGSLEARPPAEVGSEKDQSSPSQSQGPPQGPTTASREISKIYFPTYIHGEKKSLQIKEFIWCMEDWAVPKTVRGKAPRSPGGGADRGLSISDSLTSKALLVLPPLKASPPNGLDKSKNFLLQLGEKVPSVEKDECVVRAYGLKTIGGEGEERPKLARHLKVNDVRPFLSPGAQTSLLSDPEPCSLPENKQMCLPSPSTAHYLTTLKLLQRQGMQHYKAKFKAKMQKPPVNTQKHGVTGAQEDDRPQTLDSRVLPGALLPSLTHWKKKKIK
uniref:Chromosome 16 open reading frame 46 n=1 Tax=Oryctolagus cuniculus TaxID=9986 RepID=A0A5F9DIX2_RABIT